MTHEILSRLKALCEAAAPGPWNATITRGVCRIGHAEIIANAYGNLDNTKFIATARTALPALIKYCEKLEQLAALVEPAKEIGWLEDQGWSEEHVVRVTKFKLQHTAATAAVEAARSKLESIFTAHQPKGGGEE